MTKNERKKVLGEAALNWIENPVSNPLDATQPDTIKEVRLELAKLSAATDREIVAAAREFAEWARELPDASGSTSPARCRVGTT